MHCQLTSGLKHWYTVVIGVARDLGVSRVLWLRVARDLGVSRVLWLRIARDLGVSRVLWLRVARELGSWQSCPVA